MGLGICDGCMWLAGCSGGYLGLRAYLETVIFESRFLDAASRRATYASFWMTKSKYDPSGSIRSSVVWVS